MPDDKPVLLPVMMMVMMMMVVVVVVMMMMSRLWERNRRVEKVIISIIITS